MTMVIIHPATVVLQHVSLKIVAMGHFSQSLVKSVTTEIMTIMMVVQLSVSLNLVVMV